MQTFILFTADTRYRVPTLTLLEADDAACAVGMAQETLARSKFHAAVELRDGDRRLYQAVRPDYVAITAAA